MITLTPNRGVFDEFSFSFSFMTNNEPGKPYLDCVLKIRLTMLLTNIKPVGAILVFDCPVYSNI